MPSSRQRTAAICFCWSSSTAVIFGTTRSVTMTRAGAASRRLDARALRGSTESTARPRRRPSRRRRRQRPTHAERARACTAASASTCRRRSHSADALVLMPGPTTSGSVTAIHTTTRSGLSSSVRPTSPHTQPTKRLPLTHRTSLRCRLPRGDKDRHGHDGPHPGQPILPRRPPVPAHLSPPTARAQQHRRALAARKRRAGLHSSKSASNVVAHRRRARRLAKASA